MTNCVSGSNVPRLVQDFFCSRLLQQRHASPRTVTSYRDTLRLFLAFVQSQLDKSPVEFTIEDLGADMVLDFLNHLEEKRHNSIRTRNARLAAIRSFVKFAASNDPTTWLVAQRILAIPMKRFDRPLLGFLSREEVAALLAAADRTTWTGRRDHTLILTFYNTGGRVSELTALRVADLQLSGSGSVLLHGKGRKERTVPLWKATREALKQWVAQLPNDPRLPVFPNRHGSALSRAGVEDRLRTLVTAACAACPTLRGRRITPHTLRHTTAMHLLQSGVDIAVIALWLGHESTVTTHHYIEADMRMKERALAALPAPAMGRRLRLSKADPLLAFLDSL